MDFLDATFPTPEENLACDEALLDEAESGAAGEVLRIWEPAMYFAVLGNSNVAAKEVNVGLCRDLGIPILRRASGGGAVLQGPGCLNYALILAISPSGPLRTIAGANAHIMNSHAGALGALLQRDVRVMGTSDLAIETRKFSGNAQRRRTRFLLYHGTFLLALDFLLLDRVLPFPSEAPTYRNKRSHGEFLMNIGAGAQALRTALREFWGAVDARARVPEDRVRTLVMDRYARPDWSFRR